MARNQGRRSNGEGSVYFDKSRNKYRGLVTVGRDPKTGKLIRASVMASTKKETLQKMREMQEYLETQMKEASKLEGVTTVGAWLDDYMKNYKKVQIKDKTYESYYGAIERYLRPAIGAIDIKELNASDVQKIVNDMAGRGLSTRTVRYAVVVLHGAIEQAIRVGVVEKNVTGGVILPKNDKKERRALTPEEQSRFIKACKEHEGSLPFLLMLITGLRRAELLGLRYQDIDFETRVLYVKQTVLRVKNFDAAEGETRTHIIFDKPKTKTSERSIPVSESILQSIRDHRERQEAKRQKIRDMDIPCFDYDLVFCTELGKPIEPRNLERDFYKLLEEANITGMTLHGLRHTFATRLAQEGVNPKIVQELLGHSDVSTTLNIYTHASQELKEQATKTLDKYFEAQ